MIKIRMYLSVEIMPYHMIATNAVMIFLLGVVASLNSQKIKLILMRYE